jgi:hypothetical protein
MIYRFLFCLVESLSNIRLAQFSIVCAFFNCGSNLISSLYFFALQCILAIFQTVYIFLFQFFNHFSFLKDDSPEMA